MNLINNNQCVKRLLVSAREWMVDVKEKNVVLKHVIGSGIKLRPNAKRIPEVLWCRIKSVSIAQDFLFQGLLNTVKRSC